ncbi:probable methylthioribulose-1-phosphate dehydratase [Nematostella vectensis]|uniref:probable methylthioribulose-1-phosphate dehydratase n=1 Tax=Nematostella vectensis TaxID=45351 RepID=UPI00139010E3|nr:probable methylthioribulose-1-phosphate dehydratase [Nematostella vectensis]
MADESQKTPWLVQYSSKYPNEHPRNLIPALCREFYNLGWFTGTGGAFTIKYRDEYYFAPSGVQKERIQPEDLFIHDSEDKEIAHPPPEKKLKRSQCVPLFMFAYSMRGAGAVIHSHSKYAVMVSLLDQEATEFRITHQQMIKGIFNSKSHMYHNFHDLLVIPIIENAPDEADLQEPFVEALKNYPETSAVIIRRHGLYVWGKTWQETKAIAESYDYLFDLAIQMRKIGIDPAAKPKRCHLKCCQGAES